MDFDLSGPSSPAPHAPPPPPPLTDISIAYTLLAYFAFAFLVIGLMSPTWRLLRQLRETRPAFEGQTPMGRLFRAGTDIVALRSTFFADRWAWIFGMSLHFGLALILLRHLRYFIDPNWAGPLWRLEELAQPFGFYGGALLPLGAALLWARHMLSKEGTIVRCWADHAVLLLLVAIPIVGYRNNYAHTDVVALKSYALGLVTGHWSNVPTDPLLLAHLWLVAVLMVVMPFSRVLLALPFGNLLTLATWRPGHWPGPRFRRTFGAILGVILLAPIVVVLHHASKAALRQPVPPLAGLVDAHSDDDNATVMIRSHADLLFAHRTAVVHAGTRAPNDDLERCVTCHVVKDATGQPVGFDNPKHFCRSCHTEVAVTIDCFECHTSKPSNGEWTMVGSHGG